MTERLATYDENPLGFWSVKCSDCPLLLHTQALGQKDPECASGMATNMQGPVMLKRCEHLGPSGDAGFRIDDGRLFVDCQRASAE